MSLTKVSYSMITGAVVNVKDYGATGDYNEDTSVGTDDTAALQAAINAAASHTSNNGYNNGAVFIPFGAYKITSALDIPFGVSIFGEGGTASVLHCANCNGLNFTGYGNDASSMFYEDFGLWSAVGDNYAGIVTESDTTTMDGMYFNRLRLQYWDTCFYLAANWNCSIENCVMQNVNIGVSVAGADGVNVGTRIINNRIVYANGGNGVNGPYGIICNSTTQFIESIHIAHNQIYGFDTNIKIDQTTYLTILDNDLSGSVNVIDFVTSAGGYNISFNYIEVQSGGVGIFGRSQSSDTPQTRAIITSNYFVGSSAENGIKMGTVAADFQYNYVIRDNTFIGFVGYDIILHSPGKCLVDSNRCMSTGTTNSIYVATVANAPVTFTNNYLLKTFTFEDLAADVTGGKIILLNNTENDLFQSTQQAGAPTTGTWRVGNIVYDNAPASAGYVGFVCTVAGTPGTWESFGLIT